MPTYDYHCNACGHTFEQFQSMKATSRSKKCPKCGKNALERLIGTGAAVLFKGSGFYQTDYRSEGYKKAADADKPAETKAEATPESKAESKPEPKPEPKPAPSTSNGTEAPKAKRPAEGKAPKPKTGKASKD